MHILLVEDHPDNREMLTRRLERKGFKVSFAVDGAEAITRRFELDPDVVIMDISMPVMSGLEATREIRARETTRRVPIVALTAHAMESARQECTEAGCDAFTTKPVDFPALLAILAPYAADAA
ncbi:MAG: response regulator [Alphaproteobacteria bacterium]|nr:response regulator [Alphaproteobacteria bacterium]